MTRRACALPLVVVVAVAAGCRGSGAPAVYRVATGGDPAVGRALVSERHCGVCHDIAGVTGAHGVVGPALDGFSRRSFIAGALPNTPENLVRWIRAPHALRPDTAMPALGLDDGQARAIAAYLYTLR
ncbi:MAG TPA: c-type cytochrome [Polyangia bacterium]|jgi:mono/diheme cytochrome c family protein|nr:c-type cytochrome [Polyangia bacterium]